MKLVANLKPVFVYPMPDNKKNKKKQNDNGDESVNVYTLDIYYDDRNMNLFFILEKDALPREKTRFWLF